MAKAKQLGRSALALTLFSLSGCQLSQSHTEVTVSPLIANSHAHVIALVREQMDMYLSYEGREYFLNQVLVALESDTRDRFKGKDPETYAWWKIHVQPNEWHQATVALPMEEGVESYQQLTFMDVPYRSKTTVNLRAKPGLEGEPLGELGKGEVFNALAITEDSPWFLVEQKGVIKGYMHKDYARSNVGERDILSTPPNLLITPRSAETSSGVKKNVRSHYALSGRYTCRMLSYELSKDGDFTTGSLRACRKKRKVWYIDSSQPSHQS